MFLLEEKGRTHNAAYVEQGKQIGVNQTKVGTAVASDVLTGKTFTNSSGIGISGSMPNKAAWTNTPTAKGKVTIPAGYHNGSGYVDTTSVYNKGMSDADARVNTNSESYKKGKEDFEKNTSNLGYYKYKIIETPSGLNVNLNYTYTVPDEDVTEIIEASILYAHISPNCSGWGNNGYINVVASGKDISITTTGLDGYVYYGQFKFLIVYK